jgi:hypothetical protein
MTAHLPPFVALPRQPFQDAGVWAHLFSSTKGAATALFPFLAIAAAGFPSKGVFRKRSEVCDETGLLPNEIDHALQALGGTGLLQTLPSHPKVIRVGLGLATPISSRDCFYITRKLFEEGLWASLGRAEQAVIVALAATLSSYRFPIEEESEELTAILTELRHIDGLTQANPSPRSASTHVHIAHRFGAVDRCVLSASSGADRNTVDAALTRLLTRPGLIKRFHIDEEEWFHLPMSLWGLPRTRHPIARKPRGKRFNFDDQKELEYEFF